MSRRTVCSVLSAVLAALVLSVVALPAFGEAKATAHAAGVTVSVTATDFHFKLSRRNVGLGTVTFRITNKGAVKHDFMIDGVKSKLISPDHSTSITVKFKKPQQYQYRCTVPGHAAAGMKGSFRVA